MGPTQEIANPAPSAAVREERQESEERPPYVEASMGYDTPCWVWQRATMPNGYGKLRPKEGRSQLAHRSYYEERYGSVPDGLQLDHLCRVRCCVNPEHLEAVTQIENLRRGGLAKLSEDQVREIRNATGTHRQIAARYHITTQYAARIRKREAWRALTD